MTDVKKNLPTTSIDSPQNVSYGTASIYVESSEWFKTKKKQMFEQILSGKHVFVKSQQLGDAEFTFDDKLKVLEELFCKKPLVFLERYHRSIGLEYSELFDHQNNTVKLFLHKMALLEESQADMRMHKVRNRRYAEMLRLRSVGFYFSNEKMRERDPVLFDLMVGKYLDDKEKFYLRPTVELKLANGADASHFANLLGQLDETQRVSDRRKRHLDDIYNISNIDFTDRFMNHVEHHTVEANDEPQTFEVEFDSSDEEGRKAELRRQEQCAARKQRNCIKNETPLIKQRRDEKISCVVDATDKTFSELKVSVTTKSGDDAQLKINDEPLKKEEEEEWTSGDENEQLVTGISKTQLYFEFVSMMEQRFINGDDVNFFDYSVLEDDEWCEQSTELRRIREQDLEDAYFNEDD